MGEFAAMLNLRYGAIDAQLEDYTVGEDPETKEGLGRTATRAVLSGTGYVQGTDPTDYQSKVAALAAALRTDGQPLLITGLGGAVEYVMSPAASVDGGPTVRFRFLEGKAAAPLVKRFEFTISNVTPKDGGTNAYTVRTRTRPDGLRSVEYAGEVRGDGSAARFWTEVVDARRAAYPAERWTLTTEAETDYADRRTEYSLVLKELAEDLPAGGADEVFDGELQVGQENDEQFRVVETRTWDLLIAGDPVALLNRLRPKEPPTILRESCQYTSLQEQRLRVTFVTLRSRSGNDLTEWSHELERTTEAQQRVVFEYVGRLPRFGLAPPVYRAVQRGRAVGVGRPVKAPPPLFPTLKLASPPRVRQRPINHVEWETTWEYEFVDSTAFAVGADQLRKLERPAQPAFEWEAPGG